MRIALPSFFSRATPPLVGVDISTSGVKVVELETGGRAPFRLERYAIEPLERGALVDGQVEQPEAVAEALTRALRRSGTKARHAAIALPASAVITKRIVLPAGLTEEEYEFQVESEASQYIPFPMDEVNLDFQVLGPVAGSETDVEVQLVASRKEKVDDRLAIAQMAGLDALVVDVEPWAARIAIDRLAAGLPEGGRGMVVAVLDIGQNVTSLSVSLDGRVVFDREHAFGGGLLTQDIVRAYGMAPEEAEARKKTGDLPEGWRHELLEPFVEQAAAEAARQLQFFYTSTPFTRVDRVLISGGCAVLDGLVDAVAMRVQASAELLSPFEGMELGASLANRPLAQDAPALLIGCGLAMRRFDA